MSNVNKNTSIFWNSNFYKKIIFISIFVYFYEIMLYPSTLKSLFFRDLNLTYFFN